MQRPWGQGACPIALFSSDLDAAEQYGSMLLAHTERHPAPPALELQTSGAGSTNAEILSRVWRRTGEASSISKIRSASVSSSVGERYRPVRKLGLAKSAKRGCRPCQPPLKAERPEKPSSSKGLIRWIIGPGVCRSSR